MEAYLVELISLRMGSRISFDLHLPAELSDTVIAPMLLQSLVENTIKHGLETNIEGGRVEVVASPVKGEMLLLEVSDTGLGLSAQPNLQPTNHIGLSNIHERLQALYGSRVSLTVKQKLPHGVIAQLQLPILP